MRSLKTSWFTFVELIVVLVIIAILSTIWFVAYESYLSTGRDTSRIVQMKGIYESLSSFSTRSNLPSPENKIDIVASWSLLISQWDFTNTLADTVWFKAEVYDETLEIFPTYVLANNKKDFQILSFIEENSSSQSYISKSYALTDYELLFPQTIWKPLGVLLDYDTQQPIHTIDSYLQWGEYDIVTWTGSFTLYKSNNNYADVDATNISSIIPNQSCKRILEMWKSKGDWVYTISPTGYKNIQVYCDMRIDGGWWTILVNNDNQDDEFISNSTNTCYPRLSGDASHACGSIGAKDDFVVDANGMMFSELVWGVFDGSFDNIKTYRLLQWNNQQMITPSIPLQLDPADVDTQTLPRYSNLNLIYCGSSLSDAKYIETWTPANSFPHDPVTIIGRDSFNNGKIWFTDARVNWWSSSSYGFDDFQDGQSCGDNYSDKTYKGYSSYIMVR